MHNVVKDIAPVKCFQPEEGRGGEGGGRQNAMFSTKGREGGRGRGTAECDACQVRWVNFYINTNIRNAAKILIHSCANMCYWQEIIQYSICWRCETPTWDDFFFFFLQTAANFKNRIEINSRSNAIKRPFPSSPTYQPTSSRSFNFQKLKSREFDWKVASLKGGMCQSRLSF